MANVNSASRDPKEIAILAEKWSAEK